ncbi:MAG: bifunctional chorismate mutase/prephenate dehydrogenase [Verrucomicrobiae bacterium]|nr:bifunctional chorismate mutase/prephenate dehydrogenase [Verrucomicrobiae bacterium]
MARQVQEETSVAKSSLAEDGRKADGAAGAGAPTDLESLRRDIDGIDERIVDLLAQRYRKVQEVVGLKKAQRLPVYHPAREENLISKRREQAEAAGLDPDHVEELYRSILRQSRVRQSVQVPRTGVRAGARVLLVGGRGQMGQYFGRWFSGAGYEVRVLDVEDWGRAGELCAGIDLALVGVPIERTEEVIRQLAPRLPGQCVLADITSIKKGPMEAMLAAHPGPVVGFHPLFGPTTSTMEQQVVASVPGRADEECQWVTDQWAAWGCIVLPVAAEEHDKLMAIVQALGHFATFAMGDFLCRRDADIGRTLELSSPIYRLELGMIGRLFAQDPALYAEIILASPERRGLLLEFVDSLGHHRAMLESGDKESFRTEFQRIADWFGPFSEQAMRESNFLIDKLVGRF